GTHVAGTIAAVTNNAVGVAGTAYNAKIVPVRVLGRCGGYTSDIADAIVWASGGSVSGVPANANPAEVINMSLGGSGTCSTTYQNAINGAVSRGTTVVVAAGNSATNVSSSVPANCANVIAVAATTSAGAKASFSNYGTGIDVSAPGQGILSTLNSGTTTPGNASYASYNGTSMAAPHVAGVV
ncbi:S8 family serine peptidase, partial [Xanthomonas sp. Kuri4-3]